MDRGLCPPSLRWQATAFTPTARYSRGSCSERTARLWCGAERTRPCRRSLHSSQAIALVDLRVVQWTIKRQANIDDAIKIFGGNAITIDAKRTCREAELKSATAPLFFPTHRYRLRSRFGSGFANWPAPTFGEVLFKPRNNVRHRQLRQAWHCFAVAQPQIDLLRRQRHPR